MTKQTRWDYSKSFSQYHFDNSIDEDQNPPFKVIGRIVGDLEAEYKKQLNEHGAYPNGFLNRLKVQNDWSTQPFTQEMDATELEFLKLAPDHVFFENVKRDGSAIIEKIIEAFKFKKAGGSFHVQKPGHMFPYHIDELPGVKGNDPKSWLDEDPKWAARFEIQVFDWQPGHVWAYGNTYWKQWKAGDIVWHDWRHIPHGTCNLGRTDRVTLQITGLCSEETLKIINDGNFHLNLNE